MNDSFRTPADALRSLMKRRKKLRKRERVLLTRSEAGQSSEAEETALRDLQQCLDFIERMRVSLTDQYGDPLEVFPSGCRPRHDSAARKRGHQLHLDLIRIGYDSQEERYEAVREALGLDSLNHFRHLSAEQVKEARARIPGLGVAERGPREKEPWEHFLEECAEAGVKRPDVYAARALGLSKATAPPELSSSEIGDARTQLRHDVQRGHFGSDRAPGQSFERTRSRAA